MRALSWKNPFAYLMLKGKIETRTWSTEYRGLVLICASQKSYPFPELIDISGLSQFLKLTDTLAGLNLDKSNGHAIAIGRLVDCRPMVSGDEEACFVRYREGLFCHIYENVRPIEPIPWKGSQGWRNVPEEIIKQIKILP